MSTGSQHGEEWPGMTRLAPSPSDALKVYQPMLKIAPLFERKIVLLATATITDENIFNNGGLLSILMGYLKCIFEYFQMKFDFE